MPIAKNDPFNSNYGSFIRQILQKRSVVPNAAIVMFTSSAAAALPMLTRQPPSGSGINGGVQAIIFGSLRISYSGFVVCLMFAFACAFTSMLLLLKRPKASRLLNISAAFWLSSAFTLLFYAIIGNYP